MKKKIKKKCRICNTIFEFKIKDLIPIKKETNKYIINCTYCYSEKRVFYNPNPKPEKILNDVLSTETNINSLRELPHYLNKEGLTKTSNLIKDFSNKYSKYIAYNKRMSRNEMISNLKSIKRIKRLEKEKKDIWKYCQICKFSINNGLDFKHQKNGNFHISCLEKHDLIDDILNKSIVKQLVESTSKERNFNLITIFFILLPFIIITLLQCI